MKKLRTLMFVLLCVLSLGLFACAGAETVMYVNNPVATDRLNLREKPNTNAASLGKYYNGTRVTVLSQPEDGWSEVQIGELAHGYMQTKYLSTTRVTEAKPSVRATVQTLNLRTAPNTKATIIEGLKQSEGMTVLGVCGAWYHVQLENLDGYVQAKDTNLQFNDTAQAGNVDGNGLKAGETAYVNNPVPTDRLNLRESAWKTSRSMGKYYNGTKVTVRQVFKNGWTQVEVYGKSSIGYMQTKYLSCTPVASAMPWAEVPDVTLYNEPNETSGDTALEAYMQVLVMGVLDDWLHVYVPGLEITGYLHISLDKLVDSKATIKSLAWVFNENPEDRLNLRTKPNKDAASLGKYYNGTKVEILSLAKNGWVKVAVGEVAKGYMQVDYLSAYSTASAMPTVKVTKDGAVLRVTAKEKGTAIEQLHKGEELTVLAVHGNWYHVQLENLDGYVQAKDTDGKLKK